MMVLLDSNIIIYSVQRGHQYLRDFLKGKELCISKITTIEVLGYHRLGRQEKLDFIFLFENLTQIPISDNIIARTIELKQMRKMSIADAIIAASALENRVTLVTANIKDFEWIQELQLYNPIGGN